ncbi:hypothetical protein FDP41_005465 [Naegleria fowleri]|uniref:Uncharacterized protein n=1 Tax=Naegleria fowleri TaxID=5763 RepID=A0A6A5BMD2_NAEFO|nr:uncharacterized protein FDP41_005465 [Naegleria fowleri]KAF0975471.1 hypothetical protein FDP41_005465 [Naegleria fowleri]
MCILGLVQSRHPYFLFILVDNRDENPSRSTGNIGCRIDAETGYRIISAVDNKEGGTWMGFNADTKNYVVLTNVFGPQCIPSLQMLDQETTESNGTSTSPIVISRGVIVSGILNFSKKLTTMQDVSELQHQVLNQYFGEGKYMRGFNIIMGNLSEISEKSKMFYMTNRDENALDTFQNHYMIRELEHDQIHIVSNSYLNDSTNELYKKYKIDLLRNLLDETMKKTQHVTNACEMRNELEKCITNRLSDFYDGCIVRNTLEQADSMDFKKNPELLKYIPPHWMAEEQTVEHFRLRYDSHFNIFVNRTYFKTRSQSIILVDVLGKVHYFYRDTDLLFLSEHGERKELATPLNRHEELVSENNEMMMHERSKAEIEDIQKQRSVEVSSRRLTWEHICIE